MIVDIINLIWYDAILKEYRRICKTIKLEIGRTKEHEGRTFSTLQTDKMTVLVDFDSYVYVVWCLQQPLKKLHKEIH